MVGNDVLMHSAWAYLSICCTHQLVHLGKLHWRTLRVALEVWLDLWNSVKQDAQAQGMPLPYFKVTYKAIKDSL